MPKTPKILPPYSKEDAVCWKSEDGDDGPFWYRRGGVLTPTRPSWITREQAMAIALREGLPFQDM